ncbi:polymer-forming cytoskeletal protein [Sporolactobacillus sp. CPB3-1]|uniref:Polymer-forming cytoskeletal protein n=1 Tax=Sporolactobacillus mangiferae TaxID=2940498 RepID=A0ABT0M970_9BACL|nr:polymer-forming cytoskeletal protein [Sporolactobacillus mangiferae]MCL1631428.1 polymer-forming cytoskeletal protein [Sporolactobacillus mangiferae]
MTEEKRSLTISGSGRAPGGCYEDVKISGSGKIIGDIMCGSISINGSGRISGDVKGSTIAVSGSAVFEKRVIAESINVNGTCRAEGNVSGERIQVNGRMHTAASIRGESVRVSGTLKVEGDLESEEIVAEGPLNVGGLCSAEHIDMTLAGFASRIGEIGCGTLTVHRRLSSELFGKLFKVFGKKLIVDTIEGDDLYLEDTEAKVIRGNRVRIGPGCSIGRVAYKNEYAKDEKAEVQSAVKE